MSDTERQGSAALSPSDLAGIKARAEAATPGPWVLSSPDGNWIWPHVCNTYGSTRANAAHIAGMDPVTTLALLADLARARDAVTRVREVAAAHHQYRPAAWDEYDCCSECNRQSGGYVRWPCSLVAALDADAAAGGEQA